MQLLMKVKSYGVDMTPLMNDSSLVPAGSVGQLIQHFAKDVQERVSRICE